MAEYKERTRYQASWGAWYVQVQYPTGEIVELKFDHEPKPEMVDKRAQVIADSIKTAPKPPNLVELTVDNSIAYLKERLAVAEPVEVAKITEFTKTAPADEVKPIPVEPIKVVK